MTQTAQPKKPKGWDSLTDADKILIREKAAGGFSFQEIQQELNLTRNAVRSTLRKDRW